MNILFLTPRESGTNLGGVERHVKLLTEELRKRGHKVRELALDEFIKETPCSARSLLFKLQAWQYLWNRRELFRWADIVHVHDVFWWVMPFLPLIKSFKESPCHSARRHLKRAMTKTKVFVTFHGWEGRYPPTKSAVWQKRLAAWLSDGTIGVGDFYEKWYGVKPDRVVWGVVDPEIAKINKGPTFEYKGRALTFQGRTLEGRTIAFFGRLEEVNGIEIMLDAIRYIKVRPWCTPRSDLFRCIFVGDGSYREEAEKVGKVTGMLEEPWRYLVDAEVVIASSYLAILEAAAMGKRVIAVANNPLKRDYLEGHPLRKYFRVVGSVEELIEETPRLGGESPLRAKLWALGQTSGKLVDVYEELWNSKLA